MIGQPCPEQSCPLPGMPCGGCVLAAHAKPMAAMRENMHFHVNAVPGERMHIVQASAYRHGSILGSMEKKTGRGMYCDKVYRRQCFAQFKHGISQQVPGASGMRAEAPGNQIDHRITENLCIGDRRECSQIILIFPGQSLSIRSRQCGQVPACRGAHDQDTFRIERIALCMGPDPAHGASGIQQLGGKMLRCQPICAYKSGHSKLIEPAGIRTSLMIGQMRVPTAGQDQDTGIRFRVIRDPYIEPDFRAVFPQLYTLHAQQASLFRVFMRYSSAPCVCMSNRVQEIQSISRIWNLRKCAHGFQAHDGREETPQVAMFSFNDKYITMGSVVLDNQFILEYMPSAGEEALKVYLYGLMVCTYQPEDMCMSQMEHDLNLSQKEIENALRYWERVGLVQRIRDQEPAYRFLHANQTVFLGEAPAPDQEYTRFSEAVYAVFGNDQHLHGQTIVRYYEWVEELGLPQEVVLMLIRHMITVKGKNFSFTAANKLALQLRDEHVRTIEDAEKALSRSRKVTEGARAVLSRFHMRREPTEDELDLYQKWLYEWEFEPDAILEACKETTASMVPSFRYLDSVLRKLMERGGKKVRTAEGQAEARKEHADQVESLKTLLYILGNPSIRVNEGTLLLYQDMRKLYDDSVIQLAAQECSRAGGKLEDVASMLESWQKKGLKDRREVETYIQSFHKETELLTGLSELWGTRKRNGEANRKLLRKWMQEWGMTEQMILLAAEQARAADNPMTYLDAVLKQWHASGIQTPEAAQAAQQARASAAPTDTRQKETRGRTGKTVIEQQYDQRENTEHSGEDIPDFLLKYRKELENNAQGNPSGSGTGV